MFSLKLKMKEETMKKVSRTITSKIALIGASSVLALSTFSPASAAFTVDYGVWSEPALNAETGAYTGTVTFVGSTMTNATYSTTFTPETTSNDVTVQDASEEWISEETPFGKVFGSNGSSESNNYLKTEPDEAATTVITFETTVEAGSLGIFFGDFDVDAAVVSAQNAAGDALTGDELVGSSTSNGFNLCDVKKNVPTVCEDSEDPKDVPSFVKAANSVTFDSTEVGEDVGVNAWLQPSVEVSTITVVHTGSGSLRIGLAGPTIPTLAETGTTKSDLFALAAALMMIGFISVVHARRFGNN
jgi:hypothetical protein